MKGKRCPICNSPMKKNGKTKAGTQRWRCKECGTSSVHTNDVQTREFQRFIEWLLSSEKQIDMPGQGRSFRRHSQEFWKYWPLPEDVDEIHRVVYIDGIYLERNIIVLIACSDDYVLGWYLCRSENSKAYKALMSHIAPPEMVVSDGGSGFAKALKQQWPNTKLQRCLFHAFSQVRRYTTTRPKLQAGVELYGLAKELLHIKTLKQADWWVEQFLQWCDFWNDFLEEKSYSEGKSFYTHERLRKARRSLVTLINQGTLFTYLDPALTIEGSMPSTNNRIEGGVNAQLRSVMRNHRGMSIVHRIKAVYWWCYMHTECPKTSAEILASMPTDDDIELLYEQYATNPLNDDLPQKWGEGIVWEELHHKTRYPYVIY